MHLIFNGMILCFILQIYLLNLYNMVLEHYYENSYKINLI